MYLHYKNVQKATAAIGGSKVIEQIKKEKMEKQRYKKRSYS